MSNTLPTSTSFTPKTDLISEVPGFTRAQESPATNGSERGITKERILHFSERTKLGVEELAICGVIDLNPADPIDPRPERDGQPERIIILDVGFKLTPDGRYGPYDIDGSGVKRVFDKPYVLVNVSTHIGDGPQESSERVGARYIEIDDNETITLGRDTVEGKDLGLGSNPYISRRHVSVIFGKDGVITIQDHSSNGSAIHAPGELVETSEVKYDYTLRVSDYVHDVGKGHFYTSEIENPGWGYGMYSGRPIIARDTPINRGVYPVGGSGGEAIVIDDEQYPDALNKVYDMVLKRLRASEHSSTSLRGIRRIMRPNLNPDLESKLQAVFLIVCESLDYNLDATNSLAANGKKIDLGYYIDEGVGVCRTQAVLSAYIVERMINEGLLKGSISIDRSSQRVIDGSGHAWARFTDEDGNVFIIDPAQKYVGPIEKSPDSGWDYRRTVDIIREIAAV